MRDSIYAEMDAEIFKCLLEAVNRHPTVEDLANVQPVSDELAALGHRKNLCTECKGTGVYIGLLRREKCRKCNGSRYS